MQRFIGALETIIKLLPCKTNWPPGGGKIWRMWNGLAARNRTPDGFNALSAVGAAYL
jgi:hypothetical protein